MMILSHPSRPGGHHPVRQPGLQVRARGAIALALRLAGQVPVARAPVQSLWMSRMPGA